MEGSNYHSGEPSGGVGPFRSKSPYSSQRSSTPLGRERGVPFDHNLLSPVVRSKRTPIACTECRRRQVKCSGGTPRCERCEKRGVDCVYIPLHQQRLASGGAAASQTSSVPVNLPAQSYTQGSRSTPSTPAPWQQPSQNFQGSVQQGGLRNPYRISSHGSLTPEYTQQTIQSGPAHTGLPYGQSYHSNLYDQSIGVSAGMYRQGLVPSQGPYEHSTNSPYNLYGQPSTSGTTFSGDVGLNYRLSDEQQRLASQMTAPTSQTVSYPHQYYQTDHGTYDPSVSQDVEGEWSESSNQTYPDYQSQPYP